MASFDDVGVVMEQAIVAQWRTNEINDRDRKLRIGVHLGELDHAVAVMRAQMEIRSFSGTVDSATGEYWMPARLLKPTSGVTQNPLNLACQVVAQHRRKPTEFPPKVYIHERSRRT